MKRTVVISIVVATMHAVFGVWMLFVQWREFFETREVELLKPVFHWGALIAIDLPVALPLSSFATTRSDRLWQLGVLDAVLIAAGTLMWLGIAWLIASGISRILSRLENRNRLELLNFSKQK